MTSGDPIVHRPSTMYNGHAPNGGDAETLETAALDEGEPATSLATRRASWMKRLSTISTSQQSSRNSSPRPLSPSVSCSNGSMAFSHDGSTAPMISKHSPSPMPPNKLVKRSSSVRMAGEPAAPGAASRLPSLRRPATSHQRSATLIHQSALMEMTAEEPPADAPPPPPQPDDDTPFTHFFTATVAKDKSLAKRRASSAAAKGLRRVFPDDGARPTLVLARSVSAGAGALQDAASDDADSVYLVSRPGTPLSITAVIATSRDPAPAPPAPAAPAVSGEGAGEPTRPRRSFSITDLLTPGSSSKKQRTAKLPGSRLSRAPSQRGSSAPLPTMGRRPLSTAPGDEASPARRDLTDPALAHRQIASSAGERPVLPLRRAPAPAHQGDPRPAASPSTNHAAPSPTLPQAGPRASRHSTAPSEQASTLVGSDNEARGLGSGDDDDADVQSETVFDSLRTGATRSTSGARGPRIETIFDESPPSKVKVTALRDLLPKGTFRDHATDAPAGQQSIAEEEESISTPVRTVVPEPSAAESPSLARGHAAPLFPSLMSSSPPDMPKPLSLGTLEWDARVGDDSSSRWSAEDDEDGDADSWSDLPHDPPATQVATPISLGRHNPRLLANGSSPKPATPHHPAADLGDKDRDARSSIFDWSEQQHADKSMGNRTPPRPSTVHGKKDADRRGCRTVGRRAPSGLHVRSQSVPVVPDATGKRSTVVTNKFGTWGVGSKGVTEDWNDDFDFSEINEEPPEEGTAQSHRVDSGMAMVVPKTIQEQQTNVLANIGLLREWGLLIEELKEQRTRASGLQLLDGPDSAMWEEVDAMIDLADQEAEHDGVPGASPPSSPGFDEDAFDDESGLSPNQGRGRPKPPALANDDLGKSKTHSPSQHAGKMKRRSILPSNHDVFGPQSSPIPSSRTFNSSPAAPRTVVNRPRKDSEAKARSVIEALQKRKTMSESIADIQPATPTKKVPFDTATLRRIVPYVNVLTRRVKEALRDAEGLVNSPVTGPREPPFSKMFHANNDVATQMKMMTIT